MHAWLGQRLGERISLSLDRRLRLLMRNLRYSLLKSLLRDAGVSSIQSWLHHAFTSCKHANFRLLSSQSPKLAILDSRERLNHTMSSVSWLWINDLNVLKFKGISQAMFKKNLKCQVYLLIGRMSSLHLIDLTHFLRLTDTFRIAGDFGVVSTKGHCRCLGWSSDLSSSDSAFGSCELIWCFYIVFINGFLPLLLSHVFKSQS